MGGGLILIGLGSSAAGKFESFEFDVVDKMEEGTLVCGLHVMFGVMFGRKLIIRLKANRIADLNLQQLLPIFKSPHPH